jgi:hypothetical protein
MGPKYSCVSSGTGHPQDLNSIARYHIDSGECPATALVPHLWGNSIHVRD